MANQSEVPESPPAATPGPGATVTETNDAAADAILRAAYAFVRQDLDEPTWTDDRIVSSLRLVDRLAIGNNTFEVGGSWASIPGSRIVAMFRHPVEGSGGVPGDVRLYVIPALSLAGARDHMVYTLNQMTLNTVREVMTQAKFVEELGGELADLLDEGEDDEDEEDEEEDRCDAEGCDAEPTRVCQCQECERGDSPFAVCDSHQEVVGQAHLKKQGRPPKWVKVSDLESGEN